MLKDTAILDSCLECAGSNQGGMLELIETYLRGRSWGVQVFDSISLVQCLLVVLIFSLVDILRLSLLKVVASYSLDIRHGLYLILKIR